MRAPLAMRPPQRRSSFGIPFVSSQCVWIWPLGCILFLRLAKACKTTSQQNNKTTKRKFKTKKHSKPSLDENVTAVLYHNILSQTLEQHKPTTLQGIEGMEDVFLNAVEPKKIPSGNEQATKSGEAQSFQHLLQQRKGSQCRHQRMELSKRIWKHIRKKRLRETRNCEQNAFWQNFSMRGQSYVSCWNVQECKRGDKNKMCLLDLFNDILKTRHLESSWRHRMYVMLPKSGHLSQTNNGRPIAILKNVYIFFSSLLHLQHRRRLDYQQSVDQLSFRLKTMILDRTGALPGFGKFSVQRGVRQGYPKVGTSNSTLR